MEGFYGPQIELYFMYRDSLVKLNVRKDFKKMSDCVKDRVENKLVADLVSLYTFPRTPPVVYNARDTMLSF